MEVTANTITCINCKKTIKNVLVVNNREIALCPDCMENGAILVREADLKSNLKSIEFPAILEIEYYDYTLLDTCNENIPFDTYQQAYEYLSDILKLQGKVNFHKFELK